MEYINRYNDTFTFTKNSRGNIDWKGNFEYVRYSYIDSPEDKVMIDPSGGPYIEIGMDMKYFGFEGEIVAGFIEHKGYYEIVIEKELEKS